MTEWDLGGVRGLPSVVSYRELRLAYPPWCLVRTWYAIIRRVLTTLCYRRSSEFASRELVTDSVVLSRRE